MAWEWVDPAATVASTVVGGALVLAGGALASRRDRSSREAQWRREAETERRQLFARFLAADQDLVRAWSARTGSDDHEGTDRALAALRAIGMEFMLMLSEDDCEALHVLMDTWSDTDRLGFHAWGSQHEVGKQLPAAREALISALRRDLAAVGQG